MAEAEVWGSRDKFHWSTQLPLLDCKMLDPLQSSLSQTFPVSLKANGYLTACLVWWFRCISWQQLKKKTGTLINSHAGQNLSVHLCSFISCTSFCQSVSFLSSPFFYPSHPLFYSVLLFISLSLSFASLPSLLSPLSLLPLSLAVDYFWAAWLISVGSQAQCQGKWNAYKEAKRQTETSKSSLVFFQPLSKTLRRSSVCNIVRFASLFLQLNNVIKDPVLK